MPVEAGEIDQDHTIDLTASEATFGDVGDAKEFTQLGEHLANPQNGHARQIEIQVQAGLDHPRAAKTAHSAGWVETLHALDQAGSMQVAARLSYRKEDPLSHGIVDRIGKILCHDFDCRTNRISLGFSAKTDLYANDNP